MRKLAFFLIFNSCTALSALPVGNPTAASFYSHGFSPWSESFLCSWNLRFGYWGDFVFNRHMEVVDFAPNSGGDVQEFTIASNMGAIVLNWDSTWDFFVVVGASNFFQRTPFFNSLTGNNELIEMDYTACASWGLGGRGTIWEWKDWGIGFEGEYFEARPRLSSFSSYQSGIITYPSNPSESKYVDWQFALGLSHSVHTCYGTSFSPYAAWKYARANLNQKNGLFDAGANSLIQGHLTSSRQNGYAIGMSAIFSELACATIEARFVAEKALFVSAEIRF